MNIPAQILGLLGIITNAIGIQLKNKKNILIAFMLANLFFGLSFLLLKGYSGAVICLVATIQTFIKYLFDKKNIKFPLYLIIVYIVIAIICGLFTYRGLIDILPVLCSVLYTLAIIQHKESNLRIITLVNIILWTIYDFVVGAYTAGINDVVLTFSTMIAIFRYDILSKKKNKPVDNLVQKLEDFTINCSKGFLVSDIINLNNCKFIYSNTIEDSFWNFITGINANTKEEFEKLWQKNRKYMLEKNRIPTLYITPSSNLINNYKKVLPDYMKVESHEVWMALDDFSNIEDINDSKLNIKIDSNPSLEVFADIFMKSYSSISEEDPYGEMPEYYRKTIIKSKNNLTDYKRVFYVAYYNKIPIATALTIEKDKIALIGFVGTIPEYRKKGICKQLMKRVLIDLKNKDIKIAYLQTEEGYIPEKLYNNIGFKKICNAIITVENKGIKEGKYNL